MQYLVTLQKWISLRESPLAQRLPSFVPGREYLTYSRANHLGVPHSKKEALKKYNILEAALKSEWLNDLDSLELQMKTLIELCNLGAHSLPYVILHSELVDMHLRDCLNKDLKRSLNDLRKGTYYN